MAVAARPPWNCQLSAERWNFAGHGCCINIEGLREGAGARLFRALAGSKLQIGRFSGTPIVLDECNGQPFELL